MKISIIIPTHNSAQCLPRALKSVLSQSYQDFEILVVDDASTDETESIMKTFVEFDNRIQYIRLSKNSGGAAKPKNIGIGASTGEIIAILDADDEWMPTKLEKQLELFQEDTNLGFVGCNAIIVNRFGKERFFQLEKPESILDRILESDYMGSGSSTVYRREVFQKVGLFDEDLTRGQDRDMRIRLAQSFKFDFVDGAPLIKYHRRKKPLSSTYSKVQAENINKLEDKYKSLYLGRPKIYSEKLRHDGIGYILARDRKRAFGAFGKSIAQNPLNLKTFCFAIISLFGRRGFDVLKNLNDLRLRNANETMASQNTPYSEMDKNKFSYGKNWANYSKKKLDKNSLQIAEDSLMDFLPKEEYQGATFIDIGSGSGIFSLAALKHGAKEIFSVDVDESSLSTTKATKEKFAPDAENWNINFGDILKESTVEHLREKGDIVYSWGVLMATGDMYKAFDNIVKLVKPGGHLIIAVYNTTPSSEFWWHTKKIYKKAPWIVQKLMVYAMFLYWMIKRMIGNVYLFLSKKPLKNIFYQRRGMHIYNDTVDWLGGFPYEYCTFEEGKDYIEKHGFKLVKAPTKLPSHKKTLWNRCVFANTGNHEWVFQKLAK
ncbi:MAG: glycosyltransferase [Parcubacteria group bacterium]|nr:glycosyltransferase [Parcubacteria group bacterium]